MPLISLIAVCRASVMLRYADAAERAAEAAALARLICSRTDEDADDVTLASSL
ncbi:MAG: hypothetical protein BWX80_03283 [Candidatus Hydrogenedentes bacterium ADurb.Bin101]|nr:MAG: hypothetical protein BWX80_03283 [Candidatus Hydrogenedentes bacterium ADurb.Bin101]